MLENLDEDNLLGVLRSLVEVLAVSALEGYRDPMLDEAPVEVLRSAAVEADEPALLEEDGEIDTCAERMSY